jgi:hypothetical protein
MAYARIVDGQQGITRNRSRQNGAIGARVAAMLTGKSSVEHQQRGIDQWRLARQDMLTLAGESSSLRRNTKLKRVENRKGCV